MIGLSEIPCVGNAVAKLSDYTVNAIFRGVHYTFCYKELVNVLDSEIKNVKIEETRVFRKVAEERASGKRIEGHVEKWQDEVKEIQESADVLLEKYKNRLSWKCIQCLPIPKPVSRFQLGREAVKKAKRLLELTQSGKELLTRELAHLPPVDNIPDTHDTEFHDFQSRKDAYEKLWEQLVTQGGSMILGIYGMAGVGKTRLMEEIWKDVVDKRIFKKVTLAVVRTKQFDVIELQDQFAKHLECELISKNDKKHRANQLKNSLINWGKTLIILDDVWSVITLDDIIGTPFGDGNSRKGCKILLTSREESVCKDNHCEHPVEITPLKDFEAFDLFCNTVGNSKIDSLQDELLAQQVCKKCGGLPLVIHAVGKSLKSMTDNFWKDTLEQLENCKIEKVAGISGEVYACLKMSFDRLQEDAKACLLLSSLFPADELIDVELLIRFASGSQLVDGGRTKICAMVDFLKSSSLLLDGVDDEQLKLHDIIRDISISIAIKEYGFLYERCGSRLPHHYAHFATGKVFKLEVEKNDFQFPDDLLCPDLHTLYLVSVQELKDILQGQPKFNIPKLSGGMFLNLRFLVLVEFSSQQQRSLQPIGQLKMLFLLSCNIGDAGVRFFPERLETLCIWDSDLPASLDLTNLTYLRKLEIHGRHAWQMKPIIISSLSSLEELHLDNASLIWNDSVETSFPKFKEISKLTSLKSLKIVWGDFEPSQDTSIFSTLREFDIHVGVRGKDKPRPASHISLTRIIELSGIQLEGFQDLVERAEQVILRNTDVNISRIWNSNREAFKELRNLFIEECDTMEHLAGMRLYELQYILRQPTSFSKLNTLDINRCSAMKYLFTDNIAICLVQLQQLIINGCDMMEAIVMNEGTSDGDFIKFPKLKSLKLSSMKRLKSFYREKKDILWSSTMDNSTIPSSQSQPLFDGMVAFPSLEELVLSSLEDISDIWGEHYYNDDNVSSSFYNLKILEVSYFHSLRNVFLRSSMSRNLVHLKEMLVYSCDMIIEIIGGVEEINDDGIIVFPELARIHLTDLPNLSSFWCYQSEEASTYKVEFPNLVDLTVEFLVFNFEESEESDRQDSTNNLKYLDIWCDNETQPALTWQLQLYDLEVLVLRNCWWDVLKLGLGFQKLKVLNVLELQCSTLFSFSVLNRLQQLEELEISDCALLEEIVEDEACGMHKRTITLFHLRSLILRDLPKLKSFIHNANYECHMPALEKVQVSNCGLSTLFDFSVHRNIQLKEPETSNCASLEEMAEDLKGDEACSGMGKETIKLSHLRSVILKDLPNLKSFIYSANYECQMPALEEVEVDNCGLSTLFTRSVFEKLQQLNALKVSNCNMLEGIVDGRGISDTNDKIITLPLLSSVVLSDLPNFKSFSISVNYGFNMPKLVSLSLIRCPGVENFTSLKTSTGPVSVHSEWDEGKEVRDLNAYIRQFRRRRDSPEDQPLAAAFFFLPWSCPWAC